MRHFLNFLALFIIYTCYGQQGEARLSLEVTTKLASNLEMLQNLAPNKIFTERATLLKEVDSLTTQLQESGYVDLQTSIKPKNDSTVTAVFNLGVLYDSFMLSLRSDKTLTSYIKESGFEIKNDSIEIETAFAKAYLKQLSSIAANSGNPFDRFKITHITKKDNQLLGTLELTSSKPRNIDKFILKGYEDFPKGYRTYFARLKTGEPFSQKKLIKQNDLIESLPFVTTEKEPEVLFRKDSTIAYYYLKKNTVNRFDGFLGFASNEDTSLRLDGYLDLLLTNNLNYGESLSLNYKADGNDQSQLKITTTLPYLFNSPVGFEAEIALFRKDSTFSTSNLSANLFYTLSQTSTLGIGYTSKNSENLVDQNNQPDQNISDYNSQGLELSYRHTRLQKSYFSPIKTQVDISLGYTERYTTLTKEQQLPIRIELQHLFQLNETNAIYVRNISQLIDSDNYLTNELLRFGGMQSIRGFEENSLFANLLSVLNTEYRLALNPSLYINSILDLAYFENNLADQKTKLFSAGIGAGVRTQAGILKINLANGKFENQAFKFSNTKLHLTLAIRF